MMVSWIGGQGKPIISKVVWYELDVGGIKTCIGLDAYSDPKDDT